VISGDWIYVGSIDDYSKGHLYALDLQTGRERWSSPNLRPSQIDDDKLYGVGLGYVLALERTTGREYKRWPLKYQWSAPTVVDDILYCSTLTGLYAFNIHTNEQKWRCGTSGYGQTTPAFAGNKLFFGSYGGRLYSVTIGNGRKRWTFKASERINQCTAIFDNHIYFCCEHGNFHALDIRTGQPVWEFHIQNVITAPAVTQDIVCFGIWNGRVVALDRMSGKEPWTFTTQGQVPSSPTIAEGIIYVGDGDFRKDGGRVYALELKTGQEIWRFETPDKVWSDPVISEGILYIGSYDGCLYALE